MYCGQCGSEVREQNNYCEECGARLDNKSDFEGVVGEIEDISSLDNVENIQSQLKLVRDYRDHLDFIQEVQDFSSEVEIAVNKCVSRVRESVSTANEIVEYSKSNEDVTSNLVLLPSNDDIGNQVKNYVANRTKVESEIQEYNELVDKIRQLSPNSRFSESKKYYTE